MFPQTAEVEVATHQPLSNEIAASPLLVLTISSGSGHTRRLPEDYHVTSRYWKYCLHAPVREPGDVDDARAGIFLRRARWTKERARHHDAELRLDGLDHGVVVGLRVLALFFRRSEERRGLFRNHRQPELGGPARHHPVHAIAERHDPDARLLRLADDVRHYHARADHC